ncbi:AbrB/MazE/SpoVT family DNA-binding domain-containing protein [Bradyrhizobium sp.]|uniref:AbrB/MazE/SpoVT family DNA-binding domain-containing protein n=1 Tax=Bradyrhizobium sp. TaxID=376 RepID=UPI004037D84D
MRVFKWDDDLAVLLPESLIDRLKLKEGDEIDIVALDEGRVAGVSEAPRKPANEG